MATIRERLTEKIRLLRERAQRLMDEARDLKALSDSMQAERDALTAVDDAKQTRLEVFGVTKETD